MAGIRSTTSGAGADWRFSAGQPDGLNIPSTGAVAGLPPFLWMTGGGTPASNSPTPSGMTRILDALNDAGYSVAQPNVPWYLGGPGTTGPPGAGLRVTETAIDEAIAWCRQPIGGNPLVPAGLGATNDPPILMGVSNGWVCSIIYARTEPVTGLVGILPVVAAKDVYDSEDTTIRGFGLRERIEDAWNSTFPTYPTDPKWDPYGDIDNYPDLRGKVQCWYTANDPIMVTQMMSFYQRPPIFAEAHNLGAYGHLGELFDAGASPIARIDEVRLVEFVDDLVAGL